MSQRSIRRAAERSEAKISANQSNAQLSTGPSSPEGKAKSSLNAVKTGLTGRTVLLPQDDADRYQGHIESFLNKFNPVGPHETALVQSLADNAWRLERIPSLEFAIYAQGRIQFAEQFAEAESATRPGLIELQTFMTYERQLRNLSVQESRLRRQREKDIVELRQLQEERQKAEEEKKEEDRKPFNPAAIGFEFSTADVECDPERVRAGEIALENAPMELPVAA